MIRKPGNAFCPPPQSYSSHSNVNVGRQPGVPPPPSAAEAARDRITGVAHVITPAAAAFVRNSRRRNEDPKACSTTSGESLMSLMSSYPPLLEKDTFGQKGSNAKMLDHPHR